MLVIYWFNERWNWNHLYVGTHRENVKDSMEKGTFSPPPIKTSYRDARTHCKYGHSLEGNKYFYNEGKEWRCQTCWNEAQKRAKERRRNNHQKH